MSMWHWLVPIFLIAGAFIAIGWLFGVGFGMATRRKPPSDE